MAGLMRTPAQVLSARGIEHDGAPGACFHVHLPAERSWQQNSFASANPPNVLESGGLWLCRQTGV